MRRGSPTVKAIVYSTSGPSSVLSLVEREPAEPGAGEVRVQRCAPCGHWIWAPQPLCPRCHSFDLTWPAVDPAGTIYSWTRTWQPFTPELSGHLPFVVVLAELAAAGGRRLLGVLRDGDGADVRVGQAVRCSIDPAPSPDAWPVLRWNLS